MDWVDARTRRGDPRRRARALIRQESIMGDSHAPPIQEEWPLTMPVARRARRHQVTRSGDQKSDARQPAQNERAAAAARTRGAARPIPEHRSYPPVKSVRRAFDVLLTVNKLRIASITAIHEARVFPSRPSCACSRRCCAEGLRRA